MDALFTSALGLRWSAG